jgi:hypothetical protein
VVPHKVNFDILFLNATLKFGYFLAPISGVYMFSWSTLTFNSKGLLTELRVENEVKGAMGSNAAGGYYTPG